LAFAVQLTITAAYTIATNFPPHAQARVQAFQFTHKGAVVDTLRLYLPLDVQPEQRFPLLFMIYPTNADNWWPVSVAFASQEYALVAISPIAARGVEIDSHAQDARIAFALARQGALGSHIASDKAIALGGSFSSPILHRFLRDEGEEVAGWVNVGGVSNAFSGAADFYAGKLEMPPQFELVIPALGPPNLYPLTFLRYSPVYTAAQLPATLIIHTAADRITPIDQAYQLEEALRAAGAPVEVFYYEDVSHYLQIGDDLTEAGAEMFYRILDFVKRYQ
jgi:dipeptidyl aminopeptidase/acylaminoacyl peptidase